MYKKGSMKGWFKVLLSLCTLIQKINALEQDVAELKTKLLDKGETEQRRTKPRPRDLIKPTEQNV